MKTMKSVEKRGAGPAGDKKGDGGGGGMSDIRNTAMRNLKISIVAMTSTFMYMIGITLVTLHVGTEDDDSLIPTLHLLNYQYYFGPIDCAG
jgi:hypothetical protein